MSTKDAREWCPRCLVAVSTIVLVSVGIKALTDPRLRINLWTFDWQSIGALAAAAAAIAAAIAAWTALTVDSRAADRVQAREQRDAVPLAHAIQQELHMLWGMASKFEPFCADHGPEAQAFCLRAAEQRDTLRLHTLEASICNLGCFDDETGAALGKALTGAYAFQLSLDFPKPIPQERVDSTVRGVIASANAAARLAHKAGARLTRYTRTPMPSAN